MTRPKIVVVGTGPERLSLITLDLDGDEEALALGKRLAEHTGRTVTVRNANGVILDVLPGPLAN